jgi:hypothetical protein
VQNSSLCGTGLTAGGLSGQFTVCLYLEVILRHDENVINTITVHENFHKAEHTTLQLITTQSGTPLGVQCSSSRTYCFFHVPICQCINDLARLGSL